MGWIKKIAELIKAKFTKIRKPVTPVPPEMLAIETGFRPGISALSMTGNIVKRMSEIGIDTSTLPDGTQPNITKLVKIIVEELTKEIQLNGTLECVIEPNSISVAGTTTSAPPVPITATNILPCTAKGIIM